MKQVVTKGKTSLTVLVFIRDSSASTGVGLTGLAFNSASLVASYVRPGAARAGITLATQTVTGAWASGGFVEVDSANMPGVYRLDIPDAVLATGVDTSVVMLKGAANMEPVAIEFQLTGFDLQQTVANIVDSIFAKPLTMAMTLGTAGHRLAAISGQDFSGTAQAGSTNSLTLAAGAPATNVFDPGLLVLIGGTGAGQARPILDYNTTTKVATIDRSWKVVPDNTTVYMVVPAPESLHTNEGIATAGAASTITFNATASANNNTYLGQTVHLVGGTGADQAGVVTGYVGATKVATVSPAWVTVPDSTTVYKVLPTGISYCAGGSITTVTGNVNGSVASVTGNVGGTVNGLTATAQGHVRTATGLGAANLDTQIATLATGANLATVAGYLDTEVAAIKAKTDNLPTDPADASDIAAAFSTVNGTLSTIAGYIDTEVAATLAAVDTEVAAIKAVTDKLDTALVLDGAVYQYTANALENAPAGGGGGTADWNADERTAIRSILGIPASGTAPETPTAGILDTLNDKLGTPTDLGGGATLAGMLTTIESQTDDIGAAGAGLTALATAVAVADLPTNAELATALAASDDAVLAAVATVDTVVDAIQAKTDNLPSDPADASVIASATTAILTAVDDLPTSAELSAALAAADDAVLAAVAGVQSDTNDIQARIPAALVDGRIDATVGAMQANTMTAAATAADFVTELAGGGDAPTAEEVADAVLAAEVENGFSVLESLRIHNAALAGKASGLETTEARYRDLGDTRDRIVATVDLDGNRTAVSLDAA